ncbi:MAG: leucine-rich repeat domain-containing protein [Prevotella sp.]|nr:leucine-rich repeat domain-containing protein [Prevotella sp.]
MRKALLSLLVAMGLPTAAWCADGDTFKMKIAEGIEMTFKVISEEEKTCQVGEGWYSCIEDYTGPVTVPSTANGYTVTRLGSRCFNGSSTLHVTSITLPETVTTLEDMVFYKSDITELIFPNSVTEIDHDPFCDCEKLESVTLPQGMTKIPDYLFNLCPIKSFTIPSQITEIGEYAFQSSGIESIVVPASVEKIGHNAFALCKNLTHAEIQNPDAELGAYLFGSSSLSSFSFAEGSKSVPYGMFNNCGQLTSVTLPGSIESIEDYAFNICESLSSIEWPEGLKRIGACAFERTGLTSAVVPSYVESVGGSAFCYCKNLTHAEIPNPETKLGGSIFSGCQSLTSFSFAEGSKSVPSGMFSVCRQLTSVTLPAGIEEIEKHAFSGCESLSSIDFPEGLKTIWNTAFMWTGLKSITLPASLTSIGMDAFSCCDNLTEIQSLIVEPFPIDKSVFGYSGNMETSIYETATLIVPEGSEELYKNTPAWNMFYNLVTTGISRPEVQTAAGQHFTLDGRKAAQGQRGLQIVKQADGRVVKTFVR